MEELDLTLVNSQKAAVVVLLQAESFDPADFEWQTGTQDEYDASGFGITFRNTVSVLVHKRSGYFFRFEKYRSKYSPGHQLRTIIQAWSRLTDREAHVRDWLCNLSIELSSEGSTARLKEGTGSGLVHNDADRLHDEVIAKGFSNPTLFVSHSTQDRSFAEIFSTDLRLHGVDAWYSGWEIRVGDSIRDKIDEAIETCEFFVVILSKSSINRPWIKAELDAATIRKLSGKVRKILPIKIDDCGDLPPTLASLCWEDFSKQPYERALQKVLEGIFELDPRPPLGGVLFHLESRTPSNLPSFDVSEDRAEQLGRAPKLLMHFEGASDRVIESFVFETSGEESALNVVFQPWRRGDYYLVAHPAETPAIHPGKAAGASVHLYLREENNTLLSKSLLDYVGQQPEREITVSLVFENFRGERFKRMFVLRRRIMSDSIDCHPGRLEVIG